MTAPKTNLMYIPYRVGTHTSKISLSYHLFDLLASAIATSFSDITKEQSESEARSYIVTETKLAYIAGTPKLTCYVQNRVIAQLCSGIYLLNYKADSESRDFRVEHPNKSNPSTKVLMPSSCGCFLDERVKELKIQQQALFAFYMSHYRRIYGCTMPDGIETMSTRFRDIVLDDMVNVGALDRRFKEALSRCETEMGVTDRNTVMYILAELNEKSDVLSRDYQL